MSRSRVAAVGCAFALLVGCGASPPPSSPPASPMCAPVPATLPPTPARLPASSHAKPSATNPPESPTDPYCHAGGDDTLYGGWEPTPDEVVAAVKTMSFVCAPTDWLVQAVTDCMVRLGRSRVIVRAGVMDGERWTPSSCDVAVSAVKWKDRRWIALVNSVRENTAFYRFISSTELTARGPVLSTTGCERDEEGRPAGAANPIEPPGWMTFPTAVQERLCH